MLFIYFSFIHTYIFFLKDNLSLNNVCACMCAKQVVLCGSTAHEMFFF